MGKIVVVGSLNVDYVVGVDRMPAAGETILSHSFTIVPGGKGANQAFALGRMGADVTLLGAIGKDHNGDLEMESLTSAGVDASRIAKCDLPTGIALITVDDAGQNTITVVPGANGQVLPSYIEAHADILREADIVLLQLEIPMETVLYTAKLAKSLGKLVILDPAPAPGLLPAELFENVDYIKPNENELSAITGIEGGEEALRAACDVLHAGGVDCVVASRGEMGVYLSQKGEPPLSIPAEPVKAVDTTAAGDSFIAAVAFALANGKSIEAASRFACRVAAIVVQRIGAQTSIPTRKEIERLWKAFL